MATYTTGDLFSLKLPDGRTLPGRVMLDVHRQCIQPKRVKPNSMLGFFSHSILVDVYGGAGDLNDRLIPGVFTDPKALASGDWKITGHEAVDPKIVEFPEVLFAEGPEPRFVRGEVKLPLKIPYEDVDEINVFGTTEPSTVLGRIAAYHLAHREPGAKPELPKGGSLAGSDLRFSPHHKRVYAALAEDEHQSYFDFSLRLGFDIRRFYI